MSNAKGHTLLLLLKRGPPGFLWSSQEGPLCEIIYYFVHLYPYTCIHLFVGPQAPQPVTIIRLIIMITL